MKYFFLLFLLFFTEHLTACGCVGENTVLGEYNYSDLVVVGTVVDSQIVKIYFDEDTTWIRDYYNKGIDEGEIDASMTYSSYKSMMARAFSMEMIDYMVVVEEKFKRSWKKDTITVRTGFGGGDCGYRFKIGAQYLIYAQKESDIEYNDLAFVATKKELKNIYRTDICSGTKGIFYAAEEIEELRTF